MTDTPCANSTALEWLLHLHSRNTCQRRAMLRNLFTLTTGRLPANTCIQANTWEMHIWPTAGLRERRNRVNIQFLQREMRPLPNRCTRSLASARLNTQVRCQKIDSAHPDKTKLKSVFQRSIEIPLVHCKKHTINTTLKESATNVSNRDAGSFDTNRYLHMQTQNNWIFFASDNN